MQPLEAGVSVITWLESQGSLLSAGRQAPLSVFNKSHPGVIELLKL